jgi:hypothetical protein
VYCYVIFVEKREFVLIFKNKVNGLLVIMAMMI